LKDISISRKNVKWGIPLPFDANHTTYVWVDAFLNYLTGLGWDGENKIPPNPPLKRGEGWGDFWPPDVQLMSKDILRVHATIWPALLLALELPLPKQIYVHGYFTIGGQKMSKSLGNVIWPEDLVEKFGPDGVRYLLISSLAWGQDGDMTMERFAEKYNADLANGLGNLISRVITLNSKVKAQISKPQPKTQNLEEYFEEVRLKEILDEIWGQIAWANKYIEEKKLWELIKNNPEEGKKALSELLGLISEIGKVLEAFMPETSEKIKEILRTGETKQLFPRI